MRLAWPPPWHLTASALVCVLALALANLYPDSLGGAASAFAALMAALVSGHLAVLSAYPGISDLTMKKRAVLILLSSGLVAALGGAVLAATPRGLQPSSLATILSLLSIFLVLVSYGRWSGLPRKRRFFFISRKGMRAAGAWPAIKSSRPSGRAAVALAIILAAIVAMAFSFSSGLVSISSLGGLGGFWQEGGSEESAPATAPSHQAEQAAPAVESYSEGRAQELETASAEDRGKITELGAEEDSYDAGVAAASSAASGSMGGGSSGSSSISTSSSTASSGSAAAGSGGSGSGGGGSAGSSTASSTSSAQTAAKQSTPSSAAGSSATKTAKTETEAGKASTAPASVAPVSKQEAANVSKNQSSKDNATVAANLSASQSQNKTQNVSGEAPSAAPSATAAGESPEEIKEAEEGTAKSTAKTPVKTTVTVNPDSISSDGNQPPIVKSLTPDKASPQAQGVAIFWRVEADDEQGDKTVYKFLVNGEQARKWSKSSTWSWSTSGLFAGDYLITVMARDEKHASEDSFDSMMNASFSLQAGNQPPAVLELKADRSSPQSIGGTIIWTALATDPDGDGVYYKFTKNGVDVTDWSRSEFWSWDTTSEKKGDYAIAVLVRDGRHNDAKSSDASLESKFTLTASNSPPVIAELKADPSGPYAPGDVITWSCEAKDVEGDEILYKFLVNGRVAQDWTTSATWSWDTTNQPAAEYKITALARDGRHAGQSSYDSSKEATVTLSRSASTSGSGSSPVSSPNSSPNGSLFGPAESSNEPPVLISLEPDKSSPQAQGETIVWSAQAEDGDKGKIFYKFQLNGRDMTRWSETSSWKWSSKGLSVGDYRVRVLVRDGNHAPESSFDGSLDATFSLISEIDQQIDELMKKRSGKTDSL